MAVNHALTLAPSVLINDHWPNSEWAFIVDEKEKVINSWEALKKYKLKKVRRYDTVQYFHDYDELFLRVSCQGEYSVRRIRKYKERKDFTISMSYGLALI